MKRVLSRTKCFSEVKTFSAFWMFLVTVENVGGCWRWLLFSVGIHWFWYICGVICMLETCRRDIWSRMSRWVWMIWNVNDRRYFGNSSKIYVLEEEDSYENLELVEWRWKDNLTLPSVYCVISLIWTFSYGGCCISSGVAPSRI